MGMAIITGIFALLGGFIGAYIHRKTEHQKWLLETRCRIFEEFLCKLEECNEKARQHSRELPYPQILDIFRPVFGYAKVVRLVVNEDSREKIEKLLRKIPRTHEPVGEGKATKEIKDHEEETRRIDKRIELKKELQNILEDNLKSLKWP